MKHWITAVLYLGALALVFYVTFRGMTGVWQYVSEAPIPQKPSYNGIESVKDFATHLAFVGGALWFGYQYFTGHELHNLSLKLDTTRAHSKDGTDFVVVKMRLEKGSKGRLRIHQVRVELSENKRTGDEHNKAATSSAKRKLKLKRKTSGQVRSQDGIRVMDLAEQFRVAMSEWKLVPGSEDYEIKDESNFITWGDENKKNSGAGSYRDGHVYLVPGDGVEYAGVVEGIPADRPLGIRVTVVGVRTFLVGRIWGSSNPQWTSSCVSLPIPPDKPTPSTGEPNVVAPSTNTEA